MKAVNRMGKCLYKLDNRNYETLLYNDNIGLVFNIGCKFERMINNIIPDGSYRFVDIISILQGPTGVEIAYNIAGTFAKFNSSKSPIDLMNILSGKLKPMFLGTRPIDINGAKAMQYVYVYKVNYLNAKALEPNLK